MKSKGDICAIMNRFDDSIGQADVRHEGLLSNKFLDIKTNEEASKNELITTINNEFEKAHEIVEFDDYGELLSEAFNRSEDEISIEYNLTDETKRLLVFFRPENWERMDDDTKMDLIQRLVNEVGQSLDIDRIPTVNVAEGDDAYGFYDSKDNVITLNKEFFAESKELVNTIAHELRHAFQYIRAERLETREDALYKVNLDNYISAISLTDGGWLFFNDYYDQYVEVDARAFANKVTEAMA